MLPTILYIHDPTMRLLAETLRQQWAELSREESRAFRLEKCRAQRNGDWLILVDEAYDGRLLENRLRRLSRKLAGPVMHIHWEEGLEEMHLYVWRQGQQSGSLSVDGVGAGLPLLSRALGWEVRRVKTAPEAFAALFGWTDVASVRSLCAATRPSQALPSLRKLMGLDPLEAWRSIT